MRLLATTVALLGWRAAFAIPTPDKLGPDVVVERAISSGLFNHPELQQRASRFFNQATAREFCLPTSIFSHACLTYVSIFRERERTSQHYMGCGRKLCGSPSNKQQQERDEEALLLVLPVLQP
jgi:hypothetical protein